MKKQFVSPTIEIKQLSTSNLLANSPVIIQYSGSTNYMDGKDIDGWDFDDENE